MKKLLFTIELLFIMQICFSQQVGKGLVLSINQTLDITYKVYNPAIKIKIADKQTDIDYTKKEGLLQSFFSADNAIWAQSDYADTIRKTAKDEEHFKKIKILDKEKNFINYESSYDFKFNGIEMSYIKYSIKMDGLPFELLGIMSATKINNRWKIFDLPNQMEILSCLTSMDNQKFLSIIKIQKSDNLIINKLINTSTTNGIFNWDLFYDSFKMLSDNENKGIRDERLWNQNYTKSVSLSSKNDSVTTKVIQPFMLDQCTFTEYARNENILKDDSTTRLAFKDKPEHLLIPLNQDSILLIHKFSFSLNNQIYTIIKYFQNKRYDIKVISDSIGNFLVCNNKEIDLFSSFVNSIKSKTFFDILNDNVKDSTLNSIIQKSTKNNKGLNFTVLCELILENKQTLTKYLDK